MCKYNTINNIMGNDKKKLNKKIHTQQKYLKSFVITAWAGKGFWVHSLDAVLPLPLVGSVP